MYLLVNRFENISVDDIVIFLIHDGIEKISLNFLDQAVGRIIKKQHFDKIKQKNYDQSLLGRPFSLNQNYKDEQSNSFSQVLGDDGQTPDGERIDQMNESSTPVDSDLDPKKQIPMTAHALKKWDETKCIHCLQTRTSINMFSDIKDRNQLILFCNGDVPAVKFVYAIKEANKGKLDTHRYFFTGFCQELHPRYCSLIDVGTTFDDHTYFGFINMGEIKPMLGGISQEVEVMWEWSPLVICQFIDYKLDQILKAAEGLYGLVQILPGAHQFLKWRGVRGKALDIYIEGTEDKNYQEKRDPLGIFKRNVFLTEDKLMTTLLMLRGDQFHTIQYLPGARAYTDVPGTTAAMLRQRRRWLNGGFSTTLYGLGIFCKKYKKSQMRRKHPCIGFMLFLQLVYYFLQIFVQTTIALNVITSLKFLFLIQEEMREGTLVPGLQGFGLLNTIYTTLAIFVFLLALFANSRNKYIAVIYEILSYVLMIVNVFKIAGIFLVLHTIYNPNSPKSFGYLLIMAIISLYFFLLSFAILFFVKPRQICRRLHKFLLSTIFYILFQHTFSLMVKLYLVCNYHDVSWGSRSTNKKRAAQIERKYKLSTLFIILIWIIYNGFMAFLIQYFFENERFIFCLGMLVFIWITTRAIQALIFWIHYCCRFRYRLYGSEGKGKSIYEGPDRPQKLVLRNYHSTPEGQDQSSNINGNNSKKYINSKKLKEMKKQNQNKYKPEPSSSDTPSSKSKVEIKINGLTQSSSPPQKSSSDPQELKTSEVQSGSFWSKQSDSLAIHEPSQIQSEVQLRLEGSLWGNQSAIPGVSDQENLINHSLNKSSIKRSTLQSFTQSSRNAPPGSSVDSLWGQSSSLAQDHTQESKQSASSKGHGSMLTFGSGGSLWGDQSSLVNSEGSNKITTSVYQTTENNRQSVSAQDKTLWDRQSSLVSQGSLKPLSSNTSSNKSKAKRSEVYKEPIIEVQEQQKDEGSSAQISLGSQFDLKKLNIQGIKENPSKTSDPFKSSLVSSSIKLSEQSKSANEQNLLTSSLANQNQRTTTTPLRMIQLKRGSAVKSLLFRGPAQPQAGQSAEEPNENYNKQMIKAALSIFLLVASVFASVAPQDLEDYEICLSAEPHQTILTRKQHGMILYLCWVPLAFIEIILVRNFKHFGATTMVVHVLLGLLVMGLSLFSVIDRMNQGFSYSHVKRNVGLSSFVLIGLLLMSGMSLSMLKAVNKSVSSVTINTVRIFHTLCGICIMLAAIFNMKIGLDLIGASDKTKQVSQIIRKLWAISYGVFLLIVVVFEVSRVCRACSKKEYKEVSRHYSLQTIEYEVTGGRKLMLIDNRVIELPFKFQLFHPGGRALIEKSIGGDIGRFIYGIYRLPGQFKEHAHSPYAVNRLKANVVGILGENARFAQKFYRNDLRSINSEWFHQDWKIQSRNRITSLVKRISFSKVGLTRLLMISDPSCWGKHFKYSSETPWGRVTRYYTFSFALGERMLILLDDMIDRFKSEENFNPRLQIHSSTTQSVDCFPKLYAYPRAFSNFLYSIDEYSQHQNKFEIEGPMGTGLRMDKGAQGLHIALTAGTGIVPFMDMIFYILRRNIYRAAEQNENVCSIFKDEFEQLAVKDNFKLEVWASFAEEDEVIGLKYMRLLEQISSEYQFNNFNLILRLSSSERWDYRYLQKHLDLSAQMIWIRGPQDFNIQMKYILSSLGYNLNQAVET